MSKKKISFGVLIGGVSLIVDSLSGLIVLPILLKYSSKEIAGLWLFYISFTAIINLGQAGLAPVVMRKAGEIKTNGTEIAIASFRRLINKSYIIVTGFVLLLCIVLYFSYIHWVIIKKPDLFHSGLFAWILFSLGNVIQMYFVRNIHIINGFGEVGWDKLLKIIISVFRIIGFFMILYKGGGLIGLSFVFIISTFIFAIGSHYLYAKYGILKTSFNSTSSNRVEIKNLFKQGGKILVLNIVGIIIMNKDIFLVERFFGLDVIPSFTALTRVQTLVFAVSLLVPQMFFPFITEHYNKRSFNKAYNLYKQSVLLSLVIAISISILIILNAYWAIPLWIGDGNYLGNQIFALVLVFGIITIHHNAHASAILSTGANYFIKPAILNALLSLPLSILGMKYYGIRGMLIGNIVATVFPSIYVVRYSYLFFKKLNEKQL